MIILFWNVRGLGLLAKRRMAKGIIIGAKADIACLTETKLTAPSERLTNTLGPRRMDRWIAKDSLGVAGGLLIGFDSSAYLLVGIWIGRFTLSVVLKRRIDSFTQVITSVYGPNRRMLRPLISQEIRMLKHK